MAEPSLRVRHGDSGRRRRAEWFGSLVLWATAVAIIVGAVAIGFVAGYRYGGAERRLQRIERRYQDMTLPELRSESKARGLPVYQIGGRDLKKADYVKQLRKADNR